MNRLLFIGIAIFIASEAQAAPTVEQLVASPESYKGQEIVLDVQVSGAVVRGTARYRLSIKSAAGTIVGPDLKSNALVFSAEYDLVDKTLANRANDGWYPARMTGRIEKQNGHWFYRVTAWELGPIIPQDPPGEPVTFEKLNALPDKYAGKAIRLDGVRVDGTSPFKVSSTLLDSKLPDTYAFVVEAANNRFTSLILTPGKITVAGPRALIRRLAEPGPGHHSARIFGTFDKTESGEWLLRASAIDLLKPDETVSRSLHPDSFATIIPLGTVKISDEIGANSKITKMAYSPDGMSIQLQVQMHRSQSMAELDTRTGHLTTNPLPETENRKSEKAKADDRLRIATDPAGAKQLWKNPLAVSSMDGTDKVPIALTGKFEGPYALGPGGKMVAVTRWSGRKVAVSIAAADTGKEVAAIAWPHDAMNSQYGPKLMAFSHDGQRIAIAGGDVEGRGGVIIVAESKTGKTVATVKTKEHASYFENVKFSPDGKTLRASRGEDKYSYFWDTTTWKTLPPPVAEKNIKSATANRVVEPRQDGFAVLDRQSGRIVASVSHAGFNTLDSVIAISPDGKVIVGYTSGGLNFWAVENGSIIPDRPTPDAVQDNPEAFEGKTVTFPIMTLSGRVERFNNIVLASYPFGNPAEIRTRARQQLSLLLPCLMPTMVEDYIDAFAGAKTRPAQMTARIESVLINAERVWLARISRIEFLDLSANPVKILKVDLPAYTRPEWTVTADFLPINNGTIARYRHEWYLPNNITMISILTKSFQAEGRLITAHGEIGTIDKGQDVWFNTKKKQADSESHYRIHDGFIEYHIPNESVKPVKIDDGAPWYAILKLGAKAGDSWEFKQEIKESAKPAMIYKVVYKIQKFAEKDYHGRVSVVLQSQYFLDSKLTTENTTRYCWRIGEIEGSARVAEEDGKMRLSARTVILE